MSRNSFQTSSMRFWSEGAEPLADLLELVEVLIAQTPKYRETFEQPPSTSSDALWKYSMATAMSCACSSRPPYAHATS